MLSVFVLFCLGLAALYSVSLSQNNPDFNNFKKQLVFGVLGFAICFILSQINYSGLRVYSRVLYVCCLVLLVLVLFFGQVINGTKGWFAFFGFHFQPVELAKISLIVLLAKFFSNRLQQFYVSKHIIISLLMALSFVCLIMIQPDLGSSLVIMAIWFILLLLTGIPKKYLLILFVVLLLLFIFVWFVGLAPYQRDRILVFVDPSIDPLGSGYNVTQATIAIGSGGLFGRGLGFGSQSQLKFIPESQTDFLFAVIAEELGFFGVCLVAGFWLLLFYRLIAIAQKARDDFGMFLVLGIAALLFSHFFVNIGMNMGIMPVTGISLPFLSYGGSFLVTAMALIGIAQSVNVHK